MNKLKYVLVGLAIFSLLLVTVGSQNFVNVDNGNSSLPPELQWVDGERQYEGFKYTIGSPYETEKECSYLIGKTGSYIYMLNGTTGRMVYYSTNASQVLNFAGGNTTNGLVFIKAGNYSLDTRIKLRTGVSWVGEGVGTLLRLADARSGIAEKANVFYDTGSYTSNFDIAYLQVDGNAAANPTLNNTAHCGAGIYIASGAVNVRIHNVWVHDCDWDGVLVKASTGYTTSNVWVTDSTVNASGYNDITFWRYDSSTANLYNCGATENYVGEGTGDIGLDAFCGTGGTTYDVTQVLFANNIVGSMTGTTGSNQNPYAWIGIRLEDAYGSIVTGNIIKGVRVGIADDNHADGQFIISNNHITLKNPSSAYQVDGINLNCNNNSIIGNIIFGPTTLTSDWSGIRLYNASRNIVSGNHIIDEGGAGTSVGLQEVSTCTSNSWTTNDVSSCNTKYSFSGTNQAIHGNIGLVAGLDTDATITLATVGETVAAGNLLFLNTTSYFKTNAVSTAKMPAIVMATHASSSSNCILLLQGYFTNVAWSWTPGALLYASNVTAGGLTMTYPSNSGAQVEVVGYAVSATQIYFDPNLLIITIT